MAPRYGIQAGGVIAALFCGSSWRCSGWLCLPAFEAPLERCISSTVAQHTDVPTYQCSAALIARMCLPEAWILSLVDSQNVLS